MTDQANPYPPFRRLVTGHDQKGLAVVQSDDRFPSQPIAIGGAEFSLLWTTATVPADNNDTSDGREGDAGLTILTGSVIRVVDFLPGGNSPFHRTNSIDYGIVLDGEIELELDDGSRTIVGPHSVIVQRGTNHKWRNPSQTRYARVVFVLIEAPPYLHEGKALLEQQP